MVHPVDPVHPADPADAVIRAYPEGPLLVRGAFQLQDENGDRLDPGRRTVALCRCGRSATKPLCDGSHALTKARHRPDGTHDETASGRGQANAK